MSLSKPEPPDALQQDTPEAHIIKAKIWDRMWLQNEHFMAAIVGREGSGKSHTGLKLAEVVDPTFSAERVMFEPQAFLERLREWKSDNETQGKMVVIDEAGVGVGVRTWHDKDQILFNQVLQLIRSENMGLLFTLPRLSELDSQTRGRLHALMEMDQMKQGEWATVKFLNWDPTRDERDKIYREYERVYIDGWQRAIRRLKISPPSQELVEEYESQKSKFQDDTYSDAIDEMDGEEGDGEDGPRDIAMELADGAIGDVVSANARTGEPYINKDLIRVQYDLSHSDANAVKSLLSKQFDADDLQDHV